MLQAILRSGKTACALARSDVRRAIRQARQASAARDWASAATHYTTILRAQPSWSEIWVRLAKAQARQNDVAAAEASYRRALAIDDARADVHLQLGHVLKKQRRFVKATASYFRAVQLDATSLARTELLAFGYRATDIEAALRKGSRLPAPPLHCIEAADRARAAANWSEAASHLAEALRARPEWAALWVQLGHAQKEQGDFVTAEASYRRALTIEPALADAHLHLGHALKLQGRWADAAASYLEASRLNRHSPARGELLVLGYRATDIDAALRGESALPAPPLYCLEAADRARAAANWAEAASYFAETLRACPDWAPIWVQLGHAQKEQGDLASAEASYRRALTIEPDVADTHLQLGHALKLRGRLADAAASYFRATQLNPAAREGLYARCELLALGHRNAAIEQAIAAGELSWPPREEAKAFGRVPILSVIGAYLPPVVEEWQSAPALFRHPIQLPDREIGLLIDVQTVGPPAKPTLLPSVSTPGGEAAFEPVPNSHGAHISTFRLHTRGQTEAEFVLRGSLPRGSVIRRIEIDETDSAHIWPVPIRSPGLDELPTDQVRNLIIGTTGVCNANCPHCPTNKLVPSAQSTGEMPLDLFHRLVDQLVEHRIFITGHISLGLFGDGLLDRHVVERAARLRAAFPHAPLHVNTNAAAYNRRRHAALGSIIDILAVHVETLNEEKYGNLMPPLRLANVLPKIHQIIEDMGHVVSIASPIHRANFEDAAEIRRYFAQRGISNTIFTPIANRCSRDEQYQKLSLGAKSGTCPETIIFDLIVDWDGTVLVCCNDFLRQEPIGNLAETPLAEILVSRQRKRMFEALQAGRWQDLKTCRNCKIDCENAAQAA